VILFRGSEADHCGAVAQLKVRFPALKKGWRIKLATVQDLQDSPHHQRDAKAQQAHRAAPPHRGIMSHDLKPEKTAYAADHVQYRRQSQQNHNELIHVRLFYAEPNRVCGDWIFIFSIGGLVRKGEWVPSFSRIGFRPAQMRRLAQSNNSTLRRRLP
jgi:hypothetical protein